MAGCQVFSLPRECLEHLLTFCSINDVLNLSVSNSNAYSMIHGEASSYLWQKLFLSSFDDPRLSCNPFSQYDSNIDWKVEALHRMQIRRLALISGPSIPQKSLIQVFETLLSMIHHASPATKRLGASANISFVERLLRYTKLYEHMSDHPDLLDRISQIRTYAGFSLNTHVDRRARVRAADRRLVCQALVYDERRYTIENGWGPYSIHGEIDWFHVEAILNVVLHNLRALPKIGVWADINPAVGLEATRAYSAPGPFKPNDWAGVEGFWRRIVCFLDYRDFFLFNYADSDNAHQPSLFREANFHEATRLIELRLWLVCPEDEPNFIFRPSTYHVSLDEVYPPLYFCGESCGTSGVRAIIQGMVSMGRDGVIRWQFYSSYDGSPPWSSEGVQIGNVCSAFGVVGAWTTATHQPRDPLGPFYLYKAEAESCPLFWDVPPKVNSSRSEII